MVITGGEFRPDALKPKEVVSLLLDDEEMEARCKYNVLQYNICKIEVYDFDSAHS